MFAVKQVMGLLFEGISARYIGFIICNIRTFKCEKSPANTVLRRVKVVAERVIHPAKLKLNHPITLHGKNARAFQLLLGFDTRTRKNDVSGRQAS